MKSVVFTEANKAIIVEKEQPKPNAREVLVRILSVGVCGTDTQVFAGKNKYMTFPVVPFHEGVGIVHECGSDVTEFKSGQTVSIRPIIACGECKSCKTGFHNACENFNCLGVQSDGIGCEYFAIDKDYLNLLSDGLPLEKSVLIEPFAVGVHAARRAGVEGKNVIVIGGGTIGNFTAQAAQIIGAKKVAIFDISEDKIEIAKKSSINLALNTKGKTFKEAMIEAYGEFGTDVVIDCAGFAPLLEEVIPTVPKTSTILVVANYSTPVTLDLSKVQRNELNLLGSITYSKDDFAFAVKCVEEGKVYLDSFITYRYKMEDVEKGMTEACQKKGEIMKMVFDINEK